MSSHLKKPLPSLDLLVVLTVVVLLQIELWIFEAGDLIGTMTVMVATVGRLVAGASLALWRSHPAVAFGLNGIAVLVLAALTGPSDLYQWTNLFLLYVVAASGVRVLGWLALPLSLGGVAFYFVRFPEEGDLATVGAVGLVWVIGWLLGRVAKGRGEREQLRVERDLSTELAEARRVRLDLESERTRIAREVHDIVGHTLNVMLVHAGAARRALPEGIDQATEAIETIETTGRAALDDLDGVLGFLRSEDDGQGRSPLPGLDDLDELARRSSDDQLDVSVELEIAGHRVAAPVQLTAYRIAQEALTNVRRHAAASRATVSVEAVDGTLWLRISDDGRGPDGTAPGRGMSGMAQRAQLHGGTVETAARAGGGTEVRCRLPLGRPQP